MLKLQQPRGAQLSRLYRSWSSDVPRRSHLGSIKLRCPRISGNAALGLQNPSVVDQKLFLSELELRRPQKANFPGQLQLWTYGE